MGPAKRSPRVRTTLVLFLVLTGAVLLCDASKQRHARSGRHRRVPEPNPEVPEGFFRSDSQKENIFKPNFKDCENYRPEVEEESKQGKHNFLFQEEVTTTTTYLCLR